MLTSCEINEICGALSLAQGELSPAPFDKKNPHLNSKYASLASCRQSSKEILSRHGLSVTQFSLTNWLDGLVGVTTRLTHKSGQFFEETAWCKPKSLGPQDVGSAITYLKRYAYSAAIGQVSDDDDDGNQAQGLNGATGAQKQTPAPQQKSADGLAPNSDYVIQVGKKWIGRNLASMNLNDLAEYVDYFHRTSKQTGKPIEGKAMEFMQHAEPYIAFFKTKAPSDEMPEYMNDVPF